ncbi:MAG: ABC transporter permease [Candidatus Hydrogenedentes bacterium]|nr:ABC transporter permease [Candidatus Hydrogenedentota bacterium]
MSNLFSVYKRELKAYFVSPVAYVVLIIFLVVAGFFFTAIIQEFARRSLTMQGYPYGGGPEMNITAWLEMFFGNTAVWILFVLPLLSMRLFSEEKRQGTMELLFTYPIRDWETVLGKYFACVTVFVLMLVVSSVNMLLLAKYGEPEFGPILSAYLGLFLMGMAFLAVGTFISSLTENQIVAAVGTFGTLLLLWVLYWLSNTVGPRMGRFLEEISMVQRYNSFAKGVIEIKDATYYILFTVFFLFLTLRALESKKWRG